MSYEIEYRHVTLKVDLQAGIDAMHRLAPEIDKDKLFALGQFGYLMFVEHGSNNTYTHDNRRARAWDLQYIGRGALEQVIQASVYAENELTRLGGRSVQAESYIRHYRKEMKEAIVSDDAAPPFLTFRLHPKYSNPVDGKYYPRDEIDRHPFTAYLRARDLLREVPDSTEYGRPVPAHFQLRAQQCLGRGNAMDEWNAAMTWLMQFGNGGYYPEDLAYRFSRVESSHAFSGWLNDLVQRKQRAVAA